MKEAICLDISANTVVFGLTTEYMTCPIGIDALIPRFAWKLRSDMRGECQTAYEITVASDDALAEMVWSSGKVKNDISYGIEYGGPSLESAKRYYWSVTVYNKDDVAVKSPITFFETGLLNKSDWVAKRIGIKDAESAELLRRKFTVAKPIKSARLYATALGLYIASINGKAISADYLAPGWTDYDKRVQYQTYDVTDLLRVGNNAIGVVLGNGWYSGHFSCCNHYYGKTPSFFGQLSITYEDGTRDTVATDEAWRGFGNGPYISDDLQNGVAYDARNEAYGWDKYDFDDSLWTPVTALDWISDITKAPFGKLCAQPSAPIRIVERIVPKSVNRVGDVYVVDMGQNFAGVAELKIPECNAGTEITLRFAEIRRKDGNIDMGNLGSAEQTDSYISNGKAAVFSPHFTYHGFQYIEVSGYPSELKVNDITGLVMSTDIPYEGHFECSDDSLNKIVSNTHYSQLSNFTSVPTDCPQRSERSGWLGDIRIFGAAAAFSADIDAYITKYLRDVYDAANPKTGAMPDVAPKTTRYEGSLEGHTAWGDAGVALPWLLYTVYGDKRILEDSYEYCKRWIEYYLNNSENYVYVPTKGEYNDWLNCNEGTPGDLVGTAYFKYSADLMSKIATVLGRYADAEYFGSLADNITVAFADEFIVKEGYYAGRVGNDSQASYILALAMDLVPTDCYDKVLSRHLKLLKERRFRPYNGYSSVNFLLPGLVEAGHADYAYDCLFNRSLPGWLWLIDAGLTTMPESWWGTPSRNHYVFGCVCEWMYRYIAGVDSGDRVAYKHIHFHPTLDYKKRLSFADAKIETMFGTVGSGWTLNADSSYTYRVSLPANTTATVTFPLANVRADGVPIEQLGAESGIVSVSASNGMLNCELMSGEYEFSMSAQGSDTSERVGEMLRNYDAFSGDSLEAITAAIEKLSLWERLSIAEYKDYVLARTEYMNAYDDDPTLYKAKLIAYRIDRLPEPHELTLLDAESVRELAALYANADGEVKMQVYNTEKLKLSVMVVDNLPNPEGAEHTLELVNPEGPEGSYYALKDGEKLYAGDYVRLDVSKPIKKGNMCGKVFNFSKLNNWNDIYNTSLSVKVDECDTLEVWCMTLDLENGPKDTVIHLANIPVLVPHTAADIVAAVEVNSRIAELDTFYMDEDYYKTEIAPVRKAYDGLHNDVKSLVENIVELDMLEQPFLPAVAESIAADIDALPELCSLTLDDAAAVAALRARADNLHADASSLIRNYARLCDSELVLELYPVPKIVTLEIASKTGPEGCYLKAPDGVTLYLNDSIIVPSNALYTFGDQTSSLINMSFTTDWDRAWQYENPARLKETGAVPVYCLTMHPGNKNTLFRLANLNVEQGHTAADITAAIKLRDELAKGTVSPEDTKARYEAIHADIRDKILHM